MLTQIREAWAVARHWEEFPYTYFEYSMFLKSCTMPVGEMKTYIPQSAFDKEIMKYSQYKYLTEDKALFADLCQVYGIKHPKVYLKFSKSTFFDLSNQVLKHDQVDEMIAGVRHNRLFLKDSLGSEGVGIHSFNRGEDGLFHEGSAVLSAGFISGSFKNKQLILQEGLVQDGQLAALNPSCLNTFRVLSKYQDGGVEIIAAMLKIGARGKPVDNVSQGGMMVEVDVETGILGQFGRIPYDMVDHTEIPGTNTKFGGVRIKRWDEARDLVKRTAIAFHELKFIGWDIALLEGGAYVIEGNFNLGIIAHQIFGKGLAREIFN
ncbi:MAG: hypothetical protein LHW45_00265 [Candidatus Cloacimonetes bacterium]|nr:hypothetical protein [Candidatus Cloacimonadota bacterium]MDY0366053.1 sugar-transfer associated ATP-grasp domain-containing protein [Candidatus Syntrophosphaera sp.]